MGPPRLSSAARARSTSGCSIPQTRKSECNKLLSEGLKELNRLIRRDFGHVWERAVEEARADAEANGYVYLVPDYPRVQSVEIPNCTPEDLFQRLASDWPMVENAKDSKCLALGVLPEPRIWYSSGINDDEFYPKATDFKIITADPRKMLEVSEHQSSLNKWFSTGESKRTTKTQGSFGMSSDRAVTAGGASNLHPRLAVPLCARNVGQHLVACLDRFLFVTQRTVQPHDALPPRMSVTVSRCHRLYCTPLEPPECDERHGGPGEGSPGRRC